MPGTNKEMDAINSKDDIVILTEKKRKPVNNMETLASPSTSSSLSVLDDNIIKQIVSVAEIAIKNHVKQQKAATKTVDTKDDDDDDEIQVISETKPTPAPPKSNQTVLQLGLPKELQFKIIEQLKASGKSAAQIDLHNLFSEVFSKTMKKMNGLEVSNCSLRFTSNGKRKQNSDTPRTPTANSEGKLLDTEIFINVSGLKAHPQMTEHTILRFIPRIHLFLSRFSGGIFSIKKSCVYLVVIRLEYPTKKLISSILPLIDF